MYETVGQVADRILPDHVYDTAIPQDWMDDVKRVTGTYPLGMFVWCYGERRRPGYPSFEKQRPAEHPHPLTDEAVNLLILYYERRGMERIRGRSVWS
jgi:hypothetical protein